MSDAIACPGCLKRFAWTPKIAGKRVTCHCGQQFITPDAPGGEVIPIYETSPTAASPQHESDPYDLADDPPDADPSSANQGPAKTRSDRHAHRTKCPDCNAPLKPNAVVCVRCGFDLSAGSKLRTQVADDPSGELTTDSEGLDATASDKNNELARRAALAAEPALPVRSKLEDAVAADIAKSQRFRDVMLPVAILGLGLGLWLFNTLVMAPWNGDAAMWVFGGGGSWGDNVWAATKDHLWLITLIGCLTVVSRLLCASLLGADFGTPLIALLKMAAFTFCFVGLSTLAFYGLNILVQGVFFIVILLWGSAALAALFVVAYAVWDDLDQTEMGLMLAVVGVGYMMIDLLILPMAWSLLGWT